MMKLFIIVFLSVALLIAQISAGYSASSAQDANCGEPAPPVQKPKPPKDPLIFTRSNGRDRQTLSIRYRRAGSLQFEFSQSGRCQRHERGTAELKPCWWLGAENDEDESGEAYFVQEYVFHYSKGCTMYLRIAEDDWKAASVVDSGCGKTCPVYSEQMYLQKQ